MASELKVLHWASGTEFLIQMDDVTIISPPVPGAAPGARTSLLVGGQWIHVQEEYSFMKGFQ